MGDFLSLANTILDLTRVVSNAADAQPGKPLHIDILPGFESSLQAVAAGLNGLPLLTLLDPPKLTVTFDVKLRQFDPNTNSFKFKSTTDFAASPPLSVNPLNVDFLLMPPFGEDTSATEPFHYRIDVTLAVTVQGNTPPPKTISIPVDLPAIEIPSVLLLGKYENFAFSGDDEAGSMIVMVRASSPLRDLGTLVAALNSLMGLVKTLQSVVDLFHSAPGSNPDDPPDPDGFSVFGEIASLIGAMPVVYFSIGNVHNIDDLEDDDYGRCLTLVGVTNKDAIIPADDAQNAATVPGVTQVTLFNQNDFSRNAAIGDAEYRTFSLDHDNEIVIKRTGLPDLHTGVGVKPIFNFHGQNWAGDDPGEEMKDSANSVRWGGAVDPP